MKNIPVAFSSRSQFDMLELDRLEKNLEPCPLLINVGSYQPDTVDLTQDEPARDYWLQCFVESIDKVRVTSLCSGQQLSSLLRAGLIGEEL